MGPWWSPALQKAADLGSFSVLVGGTQEGYTQLAGPVHP